MMRNIILLDKLDLKKCPQLVEWQAWTAFAVATLFGAGVIVGNAYFTPFNSIHSYGKIFLLGLLVNIPFWLWPLRFTQRVSERITILFIACLYCAASGLIWFVFLNGILDSSPTQLREVTILSKERYSGRSGSETYSALIENWKQGGQPFEIPIELPEYNQAFLTNKAKVKTHEGFFGVPWLEDFWIKNDE